MARKFLTPIDLAKNEIQNAVAQVLASAPSSPVPGQFYYDSTIGRLIYRGESAWIDPISRANHTGSQAWSTLTGTPTTLAGYGITDAQPNSAQLSSVASLVNNGFIARTAVNTVTARSMGSNTPAATWTNADGVMGNPLLSIADVIAGGASGLMTGADKSKLNGVATGATANSSDATLLARANHTGTQTASTISNFDSAVRASRLDQMAAPSAAVSMNSQRITGLANGVGATDAVNLSQLNEVLNGRQFKDAVRAATTANITLSGLQTLDGITLVAGDRVLVKNQTTASQNGIYVAASGAWGRAADADSTTADSEVKTGMTVMVSEGVTQADEQWTLTTNGAITVGTTALTFAKTGSASSFTPGAGINIGGNVISIDAAVVTRKASATLSTSAISIALNHNLGTLDVQVQVYEVATGDTVECDVRRNSANQVTLGFAAAPAANSLRVVVQG